MSTKAKKTTTSVETLIRRLEKRIEALEEEQKMNHERLDTVELEMETLFDDLQERNKLVTGGLS